jgi:Helix-turn-helix domain
MQASPRGKLIVDPRLLPYYLTVEQVAALCQIGQRTVQRYCMSGIWQRGHHWTQPRRSRRFFRDAILAWLDGREGGPIPAPTPCRVNLTHSPELAAILERERA